MEWQDKKVCIDRVPNQTQNYLMRKLEEKGAVISHNGQDSDIVLVPVLNELEKEIHAQYGVDVVGYPDVIADLMDTDFKPCWISKSNLNPLAYTTVVLPEYTKDKTKMEYGDLSWDTMASYAQDLGLPVNEKIYKGTLLVVMPNSCHYNNIDYIRFYLRQRSTRHGISFITMRLFEQAHHDWRRKYPQGVHRISAEDFELQNRFFGAKWQQVKDDTPKPAVDFSDGILRDYVCLDTEYRPVSLRGINYPMLCEVGCVRVRDGKIVDKYFRIVRNDVFNIKEMHRYRGLDMKETVTADVVAKELRVFVGDDVIVGHQIYSDLLILGLNLNDVYNGRALDTLGLVFHELDFDLGVYNLPAIAEMYGLHKNSHHALDDAITTYELYEMIVDAKKA